MGGGDQWAFADSGYRREFWVQKCGNQSSFLQIANIGCIFCGMGIFLQNQCYLLKRSRFDANSVKILCNNDLKALKQTKTIHTTKI